MKTLSIIFFSLLFTHIAFIHIATAQTQFDEYDRLIIDSEYARLGNFANQLKTDSGTNGTIIIYKDKREPIGEFLRHFYGVKSFVTKSFGISPDKFQVVFGGENERHTEMWLSKSKDEIVKTKNQILDETLTGKITKKTLFDSECIECEPVVFIDEFIFREGLDHLAKALHANPQTYASLVISKTESMLATKKERIDLTKQIYDRLIKENNIAKTRIEIRFTSAKPGAAAASFYIIPEIVKNNNK